MSKKKRSDSILAGLPPAQKAQLRTWLVDENRGYDEVRQLLQEKFSVRAGITAIRHFYASDCFALRSSEAREFAEQVAHELAQSGESFDAATLALVKQKAFERAYAKNGDIEELATLAKILGDSAKLELKRKDQALTERRVALLEKKAAQADAAQSVTADAALTPAEREQKLKEIFGLT